MDYCKDKIEKISSIIICNNFIESKFTLYNLTKYYKKKFTISSSNGSTNYFINLSEKFNEIEIIEATENLCNVHTFRRQCPHYPITTEYDIVILDDVNYQMHML